MYWHQRLAFRLLIPLFFAAGLAIALLLFWPFDGAAGELLAQGSADIARLAAVALAVFVGLVYLILRALVLKPMKALLEWTKEGSHRERADPVDVDAVGEIGAVAAAFNEMIAAQRETRRADRKKTAELSSLSSIVERVTRSIDLTTLQRIVSELLLETFPDLRMGGTILSPTPTGELQACFRDRHSGKVQEHTVKRDAIGELQAFVEPLVLERWLEGRLSEPAPDGGGRVHAIPLHGSEADTGLLVVHLRSGRHLGARETMLLRTLCAHVSVAMENARLYALVITDELTQLYTLRFFQQTLAREVENYHRYGQKLCLLMLDLDDFKRVNDEHGHPAGDRVLRRIAACLQRCVRDVDVVCRYGGEEFAIILPGTDPRSAAVVAERIRARVAEEEVELDGRTLGITVSIGSSCCPGDATTVRELVERADRALLVAKQSGKNRIVAA